jgi:hypothetical protein
MARKKDTEMSETTEAPVDEFENDTVVDGSEPDDDIAEDDAPEGFQSISGGNGTRYLVRAPYVAGHVLTALEADALNGLRGENLRNNLTAKNKALATKEDRVLTQDEVSAYDEKYQFAVRGTRNVIHIDPVTAEQRKMILAALKTQARENGMKLSGVDKGLLEQTVRGAIERGVARKEAEAIVAMRDGLKGVSINLPAAA